MDLDNLLKDKLSREINLRDYVASMMAHIKSWWRIKPRLDTALQTFEFLYCYICSVYKYMQRRGRAKFLRLRLLCTRDNILTKRTVECARFSQVYISYITIMHL